MRVGYTTFSIVITTKNRKDDLAITLHKIRYLLKREDVACIICDDGSTDGTFSFIKEQYPEIQLIQNPLSKGLIYSRNRLMSLVNSKYAISIDDDLHFITKNPLEYIEDAFNKNPKIGLLGFRIFWNPQEPKIIASNHVSHRMKSFVGCGHVWQMSAWKDIPDYPDWFIFYGEEDFASCQLFKKNWEIHYLPAVLANHRVDIKSRKKNADYNIRLQRSLRAGWYLYFLFVPIKYIPRKMIYSIWIQIKTKVFKGDFKALKALVLAFLDLVISIPKIIKNSNRLSDFEYHEYQKLEETQLYWQPEKDIIP
ncbi:glycosyl transferase [Flavobacterium piscis]|uniref:Glycosyl transferase n=1 Tax=Flavobacterium piscis TaxID=1114874 RepID=A0ABX2XJH1_9FLAO|nr:glycosyltransferase [Flavobacterium piscis]OCB70591.1 glycosyl transferase [Flavobacterium piscis]OXG03717.1 glycosyl transferase [Flavobacterium piscis]